ncbi:hypothetical protein [Methylopila sp. M107]|uniref:hypothetical protein n=1 Tax=Methylopila sp. M107 TaxID=1101190 RepID=UPI000365DA96|nr:hypothetical protein [Methylopila sp. M107]
MAPVRPFVTDATLTAIAIGYRNPALSFIADRVLPPTPVFSEKFKWNRYPLKEGFAAPDNRVGRTGQVPRVDFSATEETSAVEDYGLEAAIPNSDINEAARMRELGQTNVDPEQQAVMGIADYNLIKREQRVAALVHNPNTYAASRRLTLSGTSQFSDYANSDPIGVMKSAIAGTLIYRPNTAAMGPSVWQYMSSHPHLVNAVKGNLTNRGMITKEQFAALFDLKEVLVGEAFLDTAPKGQPASLSRVWGKHLALLHVNPQASPRNGITFGFTARYGSAIAGRFEDRNVGLEGGVIVRAGQREKELVVAADVGFLLANAVQ